MSDWDPAELYVQDHHSFSYPPKKDDQYDSPYDKYSPRTPHAPDVDLFTPLKYQAPFHASEPKRTNPLTDSCEAPSYKRLLIHTIFCILAYPVLLVFVLIARNKTLFWTRVFVSAGCGSVGVCLGFSLIQLGKPYLAASVWATLIHQSQVPEGGGMRLRDLAYSTEDPESILGAVSLLWVRRMYPGTQRRLRQSYDNRPWTLFILFFLYLVIVAASLPFVLGRIVIITATTTHQIFEYKEISVNGDLSVDDLHRAGAILPAFKDYNLTWTIAPFSDHGGLPSPIEFQFGNDTVYFSETIQSQLLPNGSGFGSFIVENITITTTLDLNILSSMQSDASIPGALIRYPRWGIRIHCEKIPDQVQNIVLGAAPTNYTYLFVPRDTLSSLFESFDMTLPSTYNATSFNASAILAGNDTVLEGTDTSSLAMGVLLHDNGVAHTLWSVPQTDGSDGLGFVTVESVIVRLNTSYAPSGEFEVFSNGLPDVTGNRTLIGYDAAVCLELYEQWVLETYNSSAGLPNTVRIVNKGAEVVDAIDGERIKGTHLTGVNRVLNSTALDGAYIVAHQNSVNQIIKDNGRDSFYVPNPTLISFTNGTGAHGYTQLSATAFSRARAIADASNVLPYFAGSMGLLGRSYADQNLAYADIRSVEIAAFLVSVFLLGLAAGMAVPKLPLGVPRRGFGLYSWMAAWKGEEVVGDKDQNVIRVNRGITLNDMEERLGDMRIRYATE